MNFKRILFILPFLFLLTACSKSIEEDFVKKDFLVEIQDFSDFGKTVYITKPGKVVGSQEVLVTSQAYGRVASIGIQDGDKLLGGSPVLQLSDVIMNYKLQVDRSKKNLDNTVLTYEQTEVSLDKAISDSQLAVEQTEHNLIMAQKSAKQMLLQAQQALITTDLAEGGQARLTLDKMISDIELQVDSFKSQYVLQKIQLLSNLDDVLHQTDTIIGASVQYKTYNDSYEVYLGAKDSRTKMLAKDLILDLYETKELIQLLKDADITNKELLENLEVLKITYIEVDNLLDVVRTVLETSVVSSAFTQQTINANIAKINLLQSKAQGLNSAFTAYSVQVKSLLSDVVVIGVSDDDQINTLAQQQIEIALNNAEFARSNAEIAYEQAKINAENSIFNAELSLKNATLTNQIAQKNKRTQLELLNNTIDQARIAYQDALTQYNKLSVRAPIAGTISNVLVDIGQEVTVGTPLFQIVSHKDQLVEIYVTAEEYEYLKIGSVVEIVYGSMFYRAKVGAISSVANQNTLYKVIIELDKELKLVGDVVTVKIPVNLKQNILPLNVVTTLKNSSGFVYAMTESGLVTYNILLGKTRGNYIEVVSAIPQDLQVVLNDISNFDSEKFALLIEKKENNLNVNLNISSGEVLSDDVKSEVIINGELLEFNSEEVNDVEFDSNFNSNFEFESTGEDALEDLIELLEAV